MTLDGVRDRRETSRKEGKKEVRTENINVGTVFRVCENGVPNDDLAVVIDPGRGDSFLAATMMMRDGEEYFYGEEIYESSRFGSIAFQMDLPRVIAAMTLGNRLNGDENTVNEKRIRRFAQKGSRKLRLKGRY